MLASTTLVVFTTACVDPLEIEWLDVTGDLCAHEQRKITTDLSADAVACTLSDTYALQTSLVNGMFGGGDGADRHSPLPAAQPSPGRPPGVAGPHVGLFADDVRRQPGGCRRLFPDAGLSAYPSYRGSRRLNRAFAKLDPSPRHATPWPVHFH